MSVVLGLAVVSLAVACSGGGGQSDECKNYVACAYKTGTTAGSLDSSYGSSGSCWQNTTTADSCTAACKSANDAYKANGLAADAGCTFM